MDVKRPDPLFELTHIQSRINQLFDAIASASEEDPLGQSAAAVDVYETKDALVVEFEAPGVEASGVKLFIRLGHLVFEGRKACPKPAPGSGRNKFICAERAFGTLRRTVPIPCAVNGRATEAVLSNGVLRVRMPKVAERRGQEIDIPIRGGREEEPSGSGEGQPGGKRKEKKL